MSKDEIQKRLLENVGGKPNNSVGFDFIIAIPPNETEGFAFSSRLEIYVASQEETEVDLIFAGVKIETFTVKPFVVKTIKLDPKKAEIRISEKALDNTYQLKSHKAPISAYVLNSKSMTTDGFMALPNNALGTEYIHCSYWENGESKNNYYKSGFIVIATENGTSVNLSLKSAQGVTYGKTDKGRTPGEIWKVLLQKGQCYRVCTDAGTVGEFDISGTRITADKPIGLVSYHERATIPRLMGSSRNYLVEMIPPTNTWGMEYYSVELKRQAGGGDLFRIICKEAQTNWRATWFDIKTKLQIGSDKGLLAEAGDFVEIVDAAQGRPYSSFKSVNGSSKFSADKPIQVFQYAFSSGWDGATNYDPFYVTLCPMENYLNNTFFQIPSNNDFSDNNLNLFVIGDTINSKNNLDILNSILLIRSLGVDYDTIRVYNKYPELIYNKIPGTKIYFCTIPLLPGAYQLSANSNLGGFIYGFSTADAYGWPLSSSNSVCNQKDVVPPAISHSKDACGNNKIRFTENYNYVPSANPNNFLQNDFGVIEAPLFMNSTSNARFEFSESPGSIFPIGQIITDYSFYVKPIDYQSDMYAIVQIKDRTGNMAYDTVEYIAPTIKTSKENINFGNNVRLHSYPEQIITITNPGINDVTIKSIFLKIKEYLNKPSQFEISSGGLPINSTNPVTLKPGDSREITVKFDAKIDNIIQKDTLVIKTECVEFAVPIQAKAVIPIIKVDDCKFGSVNVNASKSSGSAISIKNNGTDTLKITGIKNLNPNQPFLTNVGNTTVIFPIRLAPDGKTTIVDFGNFAPKDSGSFKTEIVFSSNADENTGDSVSVWEGIGVPNVGVNEADPASGIKISPNPIIQGKFTLEYSLENLGEITGIEILDESGKSVKKLNELVKVGNRIVLNVPELSNGAYFLKLKTGNSDIMKKIVLEK